MVRSEFAKCECCSDAAYQTDKYHSVYVMSSISLTRLVEISKEQLQIIAVSIRRFRGELIDSN